MLRELLSTYGYGAVVLASFGDSLGLPLPGETMLVLAGDSRPRAQLDVLVLAAIAWGAVVAADGLTFAIGRYGGRPLIVKYGARVGLNNEGYDRRRRSSIAGAAQASWWGDSFRFCARCYLR